MSKIQTFEDGSPQCIRSWYSDGKVSHYVISEGRAGNYKVLCGRVIVGTVTRDHSEENGSPIPICAACRRYREKERVDG